jgi:hypothetical protein
MPTDRSATSLVKGPVSVLGGVLVAYGVLGLIFGGSSFTTADVPDGPVTGDDFLGLEGNGWMNVLWIGAGGLLLLAAPADAPARAAAVIAGLVLGAASVISLFTYWFDDHWGVFGILAANNWTTLALGVVALLAFAAASLPRTRRTEDETLPPFAAHRTTDATDRFGRERQPARDRSELR